MPEPCARPPEADDYALLLKSFARSQRAAGRAPATIANAQITLRQFGAFLARTDPRVDVHQVDRATVEAYLVALRSEPTARGKPVAAATIQLRYVQLHGFFNWLVDADELDISPMAKLHQPKAPLPVTRLYSDDELRALLATCERLKTFTGKLHYALLRLLLDTGLRCGEAAALMRADVDLDQGTVTVLHGKGDKPRVVPFNSKAAAALDRYIRERRRHKHAALPELWLGRKGPLTASALYDAVVQRGQEAGLRDLHPHSLRHQFIDACLTAGMTEGQVMRLTGHASHTVFRRYASARADQRAHDAARALKVGDRI